MTNSKIQKYLLQNYIIVLISQANQCLTNTNSNIHTINLSLQENLYQKLSVETNYRGYITIDNTQNSDLFYWHIPSRTTPETDPLVFWFTGGPGCSSQPVLLTENGPFFINPATQKIELNPTSFNIKSNQVYIDQPQGTGLSKISDPKYYRHDEYTISQDFYDFLLKFLEKYPKLKGRALYFAGESYSGHYIPNFAAYILKQKNPIINLKGLLIGNGAYDEYNQYKYMLPFAIHNGLLFPKKDKKLIAEIQENETECLKNLKNAQNEFKKIDLRNLTKDEMNLIDHILEQCNSGIAHKILDDNPNVEGGKVHLYNISKKCYTGNTMEGSEGLCYDYQDQYNFFAKEEIKKFFEMNGRKYVDCNTNVFDNMRYDIFDDSTSKFSEILRSGVKITAYNGELDFICNWESGLAAINGVKWEGQKEFQRAEVVNIGYGLKKRHKNLEFVKFFNSGHMVPQDQPELSMDLFIDHIFGN